MLIDEIHKHKNFSQELKAIYDVFDMQVTFSGSSALQIEHASADLSRRAVVHTLGVLSLREFVEMQTGLHFSSYTLDEIRKNHYDISATIMQKIRPLEQFENYKEYGCYPFFQESLIDYPQKLLEVINLTIDSDLSTIYNIEPSKIDKLLLDNPNLFRILCAEANSDALSESFFVSQVGLAHQVHFFDKGDFIVDDRLVFEVGGASKDNKQLENNSDGYIVSDDIEIGFENKIPLWLFGFLY